MACHESEDVDNLLAFPHHVLVSYSTSEQHVMITCRELISIVC